MIYCICGFPRSGSTMLYNMMRYSVYNVKFYDREISAASILSSKETVCTKRPMDIFKCEELAEKTDIQFIIIIRDPRDILTSIHANSEGQWKVNCDYSLKTSDKGVCGKTNGLMDYYHQLPKVPDPVIVRYESLVSDPNAEQIFLETQFPEIDFFRNFNDFYLSQPPPKLTHQLNGLRPPSTDNIGRWKKYPERIKSEAEKCPELLEMIVDLGYEKDDRWLNDI